MSNISGLSADERAIYNNLNSDLLTVNEMIAKLAEESKVIEMSSDEIDNASEIERQTSELQKLSQQKVRKAQLERALSRVLSSDYGWCDDCGDEIAQGRINAIPDAVTCISCQSVRERKEQEFAH